MKSMRFLIPILLLAMIGSDVYSQTFQWKKKEDKVALYYKPDKGKGRLVTDYLYDEEQMVGMITVGVYAAPTGVKGWIEDVVVDARFRGCGYGRRLVEKAIAFARTQGVNHLMLTSNPTRKAANALYQALGFEQRTTNCYKMEL